MLDEKPTAGGSSSIKEIHTEPISSQPKNAAQGGNPTEPQTSAAGGSSFAFQYGKRHVKAYPITESELSEIGTLRGLSTFCFSVSSALLGFGGNMFVSYLSAPSEPIRNNSTDWKTGIISALGVALVFLLIGAFLMYKGHTKIADINRETLF
jgi:hypothetical protein